MFLGRFGKIAAFLFLAIFSIFYWKSSNNQENLVKNEIFKSSLDALPPPRLKMKTMDERWQSSGCVYDKIISKRNKSLIECELQQWTFNRFIAKYWLTFNQTEQRRFKEFRENQSVYPAFIIQGAQYIRPKGSGLQVCLIAKSMSTMGKMIMCNLNKLMYKKKRVTNEMELMASCRHLYRKTFDQRRFWLNFAVIRNPINRFISVYKYLCFYVRMCGKYGNDFPKMVDQFDRMFRTARRFRGRMRKSSSYAMHHLKPQSWDCHFNKFRDNYRIVDYEENLREQWQQTFYDAGISENTTLQPADHSEMPISINQTAEKTKMEIFPMSSPG